MEEHRAPTPVRVVNGIQISGKRVSLVNLGATDWDFWEQTEEERPHQIHTQLRKTSCSRRVLTNVTWCGEDHEGKPWTRELQLLKT